MTSLIGDLHYPNEDKKILYKHMQMWYRDVRRVAFPSFPLALIYEKPPLPPPLFFSARVGADQ